MADRRKAAGAATGHETPKETTTMEPTIFTLAQVCEEIMTKDPAAGSRFRLWTLR
jgi:hypothetical protein